MILDTNMDAMDFLFSNRSLSNNEKKKKKKKGELFDFQCSFINEWILKWISYFIKKPDPFQVT